MKRAEKCWCDAVLPWEVMLVLFWFWLLLFLLVEKLLAPGAGEGVGGCVSGCCVSPRGSCCLVLRLGGRGEGVFVLDSSGDVYNFTEPPPRLIRRAIHYHHRHYISSSL